MPYSALLACPATVRHHALYECLVFKSFVGATMVVRQAANLQLYALQHDLCGRHACGTSKQQLYSSIPHVNIMGTFFSAHHSTTYQCRVILGYICDVAPLHLVCSVATEMLRSKTISIHSHAFVSHTFSFIHIQTSVTSLFSKLKPCVEMVFLRCKFNFRCCGHTAALRHHVDSMRKCCPKHTTHQGQSRAPASMGSSCIFNPIDSE